MALSTMHRYPTVVSHTGLTTDCSTIDCSTQTRVVLASGSRQQRASMANHSVAAKGPVACALLC